MAIRVWVQADPPNCGTTFLHFFGDLSLKLLKSYSTIMYYTLFKSSRHLKSENFAVKTLKSMSELQRTATAHLRVTHCEVLFWVIPFWRITSTESLIIVCFFPGEFQYNPSTTGIFLVSIQYLKLTGQMLIFGLQCCLIISERGWIGPSFVSNTS